MMRTMNSETTKCLTMVPVMEYIFAYFDQHGVAFRCEHILSNENSIADALSRGDGFPFSGFENRQTFRVYPSLIGLKSFVIENELYLQIPFDVSYFSGFWLLRLGSYFRF